MMTFNRSILSAACSFCAFFLEIPWEDYTDDGTVPGLGDLMDDYRVNHPMSDDDYANFIRVVESMLISLVD